MSSFRPICIAALTAAMIVFVVDAAAAQNTTDHSGKPYLAGLHPPHEQHKPASVKTSHGNAQLTATSKRARTATKRQPIVTAKAKHHSMRLAERINSRIAWPSVEPVADRAASETVLQFATEDTEPGASPRPTVPASTTSAPKTAPPAKIIATNQPDNAQPAANEPAAADTLAQTERFEAPATSQVRVIVPALSETPVTAPAPKDQPAARNDSSTAQILATLAGAISAGIVGWFMIGFGSIRTINSSRT